MRSVLASRIDGTAGGANLHAAPNRAHWRCDMAAPNSTAERFWSKVERIPFHTCWEWTGSLAGTGYGSISWHGRQMRAHRLAWQLTYGPIPKGTGAHGTCVLHRCDNPPCVRPEHLFLGTNHENVLDCIAKGRSRRCVWRRSLTHCFHGHEFSEENVFINGLGHRVCKPCRRFRKKHYRRRRVARLRSVLAEEPR